VDNYRLLFTEEALTDLANIIDFIAEEDPESASRFGTALLDHIELLKRFPRIGSPVRKSRSVRTLVHSPILVFYEVHDDRRIVEVLYLRHGSRRPARP
jgi:plasmid stabilization system protein ParE